MKGILFSLIFLFAGSAFAANSVHEACKRLCENESQCAAKCVNHAELMEVQSDLIDAATQFHKSAEIRLSALRTGANLETFDICGKTGWSTDNKLICLRAYPTPELIKSCKKLSAKESEQVTCVRNGKTASNVEACVQLMVSPSHRLECLEMTLTTKEKSACGQPGWGSYRRMACLDQADAEKKSRAPASARKN